MSPHRGLHPEYDGAIDWSSLFPLPRRDIENEGARAFSDSQWLGLIHRGSDKTRFQQCLDASENLIYSEPFKVMAVLAARLGVILDSITSFPLAAGPSGILSLIKLAASSFLVDIRVVVFVVLVVVGCGGGGRLFFVFFFLLWSL